MYAKDDLSVLGAFALTSLEVVGGGTQVPLPSMRFGVVLIRSCDNSPRLRSSMGLSRHSIEVRETKVAADPALVQTERQDQFFKPFDLK